MNLINLKFDFLRVVTDYEHYVALNLPYSTEIENHQKIFTHFWKDHFLSGLIIEQQFISLTSENPAIRKAAIDMFSSLLWKHDLDQRYQSRECREKIARIYFPFVVKLVENIDIFMKLEIKEQRDWIVCFMWILMNCNMEKILKKWWLNDTIKNQKSFLELLFKALQVTEGNKTISFVILQIIEEMMLDNVATLKEVENDDFLGKIFRVFYQLLDNENQSALLLKMLFESTLKKFVNLFQKVLFEYQNTSKYCGEFSYQTIKYLNVANGEVRACASAFFYLLLKTNFKLRGNIARFIYNSIYLFLFCFNFLFILEPNSKLLLHFLTFLEKHL